MSSWVFLDVVMEFERFLFWKSFFVYKIEIVIVKY